MSTSRSVRAPWIVLLIALLTASHASTSRGQTTGEIAGTDHASVFRLRGGNDDFVILEWDRAAVRELAAARTRARVPNVVLRAGLAVELEIEPFSVVTPRTRFVLGSKDGPDRPLDFDPAAVSLFRGEVVGYPGSHVFLALSRTRSTGTIDLGAVRYRVGSARDDGTELPPGQVSVFETGPPPAMPPDVPFCGVEPEEDATRTLPAFAGSTGPLRGLQHLELAVETDHEFFVLFDDANDAMAYLTAMYGEVSDVYMRDVDTWVELVFARLWDDPDDLFNDVDPSPLSDFQNYWNANMGSVDRDVAQLLSGRRDYPFGGQAYLAELCSSSAYSVVGYAMGFFPDPSMPSPYHYDISVTAHEIGHNAGTGHTHDSANDIDTCDDPGTTPQRGTIMSYCGQTWSGGNANRDLYFHSIIQANMDAYIGSVSCVVDDCNRNGVDDATDIADTTSDDVNMNGIPDECEDCNGNMVLDDTDIAMGSPDVDANGVPDECEPDCNGNSIPDAKDIADGTSDDLYGDDVPDECEADCDASGVSDYTEIQADMTLDVDRNRILDACQDCDTDGATDFEELAGAHNAWVASGLASSSVREFHATTGVLTTTSSGGAGALTDEAFDVIVSPGGSVLVTSHADHRVLEFDESGNYLGDLVAAGAGGLTGPAGLTLTPDEATLLVASEATDSVLAYDAATGGFSGVFVTPGDGGLSGPFGLLYGPNGNLFVTSDAGEVLEYDGQNGAFVRVFVDAAAGGGLDQPRGIAFKPDGNLLVASFGTDEVLEYDGQTGAPLGKWAQVGTATRLTQVSPWG
ncbi:MAG: M12 family metallo-peptidase, partial [Acidobacteriota bacterium]|nr:M12 family metallo-peptidase [Acidobacteriota bacterium]